METYVDPHAGKRVIYYDEHSRRHEAIVTICHGAELGVAAINLVYVSEDPEKKDQYGRQIERVSSVAAKHEQYTAHGRYYEVPE